MTARPVGAALAYACHRNRAWRPAESRTSDVVDALVAVSAGPGDQVLTSGDDLAALVAHRPGPISVVEC